MPGSQPYFYTSPRTVALVDRPQMIPSEGPVADSMYGYHTLWAAEVPFIPAYIGRDDRDFDADTSNRISRIVQRQVRFLYDLAQSREHLATFEMRLVAWPHATGQTQVGIAFLSKTFHPNEQMSRKLALALWEKFSAIFPREVPFSYPLLPVQAEPTAHTRSFQEWYEPVPFAELTQTGSIIELRKYEDWPTLRNVGGVYHAHDYIPHPFVPALDYSAMARLFETLAHQQKPCIVGITVRPQPLTDQEELILHEHARWFERVAQGQVDDDNPLTEVMQELKNDVFDAYPRAHAAQGLQVYNVLKRECRSLFSVRLQVVGLPIAQETLIEALGSEVMANAGNAYPSRWTRTEASNQSEFRWALFNLQWLEFARWGISPLIQQAPAIVRLRQLATVLEVSGAFRLPTAPGSTGLVGVEVRDEPFLPPLVTRNESPSGLNLGSILDRGISTNVPYTLPGDTFSGLTHLFGEASETRTRALQAILKGLSSTGMPWMLLGSNGVNCAQLAAHLQVPVHRLDAVRQPLDPPFHPLLPPAGVSSAQFVDALVRVFMTVYLLDFSAAALLRRAFLQAYESVGWHEGQSTGLLDIAMLVSQIEHVAHQAGVPAALTETLLTRCVVALQDLILTIPNLTATLPLQATNWLESCCIEFGWLGSDTNSALLRGCLWAWFAHTCAARQRKGVIVVMDAHTLFGETSAQKPFVLELQSSPLNSLPPTVTLAQQFAHQGVGTLCIDERPDLLHAEIVSRANLTLLTRTANTGVAEHIATLLGVSSRQRQRIGHLRDAEVLVALRNIPPVLIEL